jgi:predicted nuclease of predicted toxin-antitoxin system
MRFLIDEYLSTDLIIVASAAGHEAQHVARIGKAGWKDWNVARHAAEGDFVLVTNNASDFRRLYATTALHAGLIVIVPNVGRALQAELFRAALECGDDAGRPCQSCSRGHHRGRGGNARSLRSSPGTAGVMDQQSPNLRSAVEAAGVGQDAHGSGMQSRARFQNAAEAAGAESQMQRVLRTIASAIIFFPAAAIAAGSDTGMVTPAQEVAVRGTSDFAPTQTQLYEFGFVALIGLATLAVQAAMLFRSNATVLEATRMTMVTLIITLAVGTLVWARPPSDRAGSRPVRFDRRLSARPRPPPSRSTSPRTGQERRRMIIRRRVCHRVIVGAALLWAPQFRPPKLRTASGWCRSTRSSSATASSIRSGSCCSPTSAPTNWAVNRRRSGTPGKSGLLP